MSRQEYNVTVLSRREVTAYAGVGKPFQQYIINYVGAQLPPSSVIINVADYTEALEKKRIREHIEQRLKDRPRALRV